MDMGTGNGERGKRGLLNGREEMMIVSYAHHTNDTITREPYGIIMFVFILRETNIYM